MKELSEQEVIDAADCCLNPKSNVDCKKCPLNEIEPKGECRRLALEAIKHHIQKLRMQHTALHTTLQEMEKKDPARNYSVCVKVKNGIIYAKTLKDYDNIIGATFEEMINEISSRIWAGVPEHVIIPLDRRFVRKEEFISILRSSGGLK